MKTLDKQLADIVDESLKSIIESTSAGPGQSILFKDAVGYRIAKEILFFYYPLSNRLPEETKRAIINTAIMRWLKYKGIRDNSSRRISSFHIAVETVLRMAHKEKPHYAVLMFLNIEPRSLEDYKNIVILGDSLRFLTWQDLSRMETEKLWQEVHSRDMKSPILWDIPDLLRPAPDAGIFTPIIFEVDTFGSAEAVEIAIERVDLLRCLFNLPFTLGRYTYFRSEPKPLSTILPSPIYGIFDQSGKYLTHHYTIEKYRYKRETISAENKKLIQFLSPKFAAELNSDDSWTHVLNILLQYQKALDITLPETAYLAMWQVLENGIGFGETLDLNRDIEARISNLIKLNPVLKIALHMVTKQRNALVHPGNYPNQGDDVFFILKIYIDAMIRSLISLADQFHTTEEMKDFIRFSTLGDSELERKKMVFTKILESRAEKKKA